MLACWLHDISKYEVVNKRGLAKADETHHIDSYKFTLGFLQNYGLPQDETDLVANAVIRHRNSKPYLVETSEDKIVAVVDTMSHFTGLFYFCHWFFRPDDTLEEMVEIHLAKLERDWRDLALLPRAQSLVRKEYEIIKKLHQNYLRK